MRKYFGTLNVSLGEVQRLVRGDRDYPLGGLPDVLSAMNSLEWKKGRLRGFLGESYIQLIRFSENGVKIESVHCFGASNKVGSPHFDDQVDLFLEQKTKTMSLDKQWIMDHAERTYHPGE